MMATRRLATLALASWVLTGCASGRGRAPGEPMANANLGEVPQAPAQDRDQAHLQKAEMDPDENEGEGEGEGEGEQEIARGLASWYGKKFHGRRTASGERFDMNDLTAAHPNLPFGTRLTVHNPRNGRSVTVRVNDRGPHTGKRIIDLSRAAAKAIGLVGAGISTVVLLRA